LAAGYAPLYAETELDARGCRRSARRVRQVLTGHEPYPAAAVDRAWNLVDTNAPLAMLTAGTAPELLEPRPTRCGHMSPSPPGTRPHPLPCLLGLA
jgi:MmyB-like transcription regulator ligand binding domain